MTVQRIRTVALGSLAALTACVGGLAFGQGNSKEAKPPAAKPAEAVADKKPSLKAFRLGATRDELVKNYGEPTKVARLGKEGKGGIESLKFQHRDDFWVFAEVRPDTGHVIQIYYRKMKTPFTPLQIAELLDRNAEGARWWPEEVAASKEVSSFRRTDGGSARSGWVGDWHQVAVLSGGEVRGRDPTADREREHTVKDALQEIE